jgi:hypothetical protein
MVLNLPQELPNPLRNLAGQAVVDAASWPARRQEVVGQLLPLVYGDLPQARHQTRILQLHAAVIGDLSGAHLRSCRVWADGAPPFMLRLFVPAGPGPFPALVSGDACWHYANDVVLKEVLGRGYCFAEFNRVEVAPDPGGPFQLLPMAEAAAQFCTLASWAQAYHRVVDVLQGLDWIDRSGIAVVGHSRGGKAALLAGATDTRIALTSANNSGAGGAGSFRWTGPGAETLTDLVGSYGHWFSPALRDFAGREHTLPFDQNLLKALVAPRALLTTEALGDHWANPQGSWQTHRASQCVFDLLGAADRLAIGFRPGGHAHTLADWRLLLDFADAVFRGTPIPAGLSANPYPDLPLPARWLLPGPGSPPAG